MSSGDSRKRATRTGPRRKSDVSTTPRTSGSPTISTASRPGVTRLLAELDAALATLGCRWYVFGAQAAVAYGRPRMTADVDVTVELGARSSSELLATLGKAGFLPRLELTDAFIAEARLFPLVHLASTIPIDLLLAGSGLHAEFLARRRHVAIDGVPIPMLSPEDLVITKILAGRRKDLEDVRGVLLEQGGAFDPSRVRTVLANAEQALERPGLLRRFERLLRSAGPTSGW